MKISLNVLGFLRTTEALRAKGKDKQHLIEACNEKLKEEGLTQLERNEIEAKKRAISAG